MDSGFTLTIDWLAFTVLASNPQETMKVLGGDWSKAKGGFRGYPLSWMRADGLRGVGKLGTNAPRRPNEIHVDLSGGLASALTLDQIRTLLKWVHKQQGHVTRIDCALDDRAGAVPVSTIREAVSAGQCVTRAAQVRHIVSNLTHGTGATTGETMYFGSPQSQTLLRIYDKRLELQSKGQGARELAGVWDSVGVGTEEGSGRTMCPRIGDIRRSRLEGVGHRLASILCGLPADSEGCRG